MSVARLALFREVTSVHDCPPSIANSAGLRGAGAVGGDWVRPGLALYGACPFADCAAADLGLKPVMTLTTCVIALRQVARGQSVGYGAAWVAPRDSLIASMAAGDGDGGHRSLANGAPVLPGGERAAPAGRESLDMLPP